MGIGSVLSRIGSFAPQLAPRKPTTPPFLPPGMEDSGQPYPYAPEESVDGPQAPLPAKPPVSAASQMGGGAAPQPMPTYRPEIDPDTQKYLDAARQPAPAHPQHGRLRGIAEAMSGGLLGQPLNEQIWDRDFARQKAERERNIANAALPAAIRQKAEAQTASTSHTMASGARTGKQAENYDSDSVLKAVERGGELPDETGAATAPEQPRKGSTLSVGKRSIFFPTKGQQATDAAAVKTQAAKDAERPLPPEVAKGLGLPDDFRVPPTEVDSYVRLYEAKTKDPDLQIFKSDDEVSGTTTIIGVNKRTGKITSQVAAEGSPARKRPPQDARGSFTPIVNETGEITSFFNAATGQNVDPPAGGGRKSPLSPTENIRRATLSNTLEDLVTLEKLGAKNKDKIGPVLGRLTEAQLATLGEENPEIAAMFRTSSNLSDQLLRMRSGAAITEGEYARLAKLVPNPKMPYNTFVATLHSYQQEIQRIAPKSTGGRVGADGSMGSTPSPTPQVPAVDSKVKAYADQYFGGDLAKAQAAIAAQRQGK